MYGGKMTTRRIFAKSLLGAACAAGFGTAAMAQYTTMPVPSPMPPYPPGWKPPPPLRYEAVPPPPGASYAWVPGHWRWDGYRYIWVAGRYDVRRPSWHRWVNGRWVVVNGRWTWVPGHWV
jgi:hypothetical protein